MKKIINYKLEITNSSEAGVTLLITVMILAGLTLISLSIGAFAIQSLRSARAAAITEPAIGAAESGGEQGIWAIKRSGSATNCANGTDSNQLSAGSTSWVVSCRSFAAATFAVKAGSPSTFYLYDPAYPTGNGDTDMSNYPITHMTLANNTGLDNVDVTVMRLDGTGTYINPTTLSIYPGTTEYIIFNQVPLGTEGRIQVTLSTVGNNTVTADTYNGNANELGMPTFPTVDSIGCSSRSTVSDCNNTNQEIYSRRINITVPQ